MGPEALAQVLRPLAGMFDPAGYPDLLRGLESPDDAAVWRLDGERALVVTADFFPPVVDDPYHYGAIAAANALSDLYAMGAEPIFAINLVGFPEKVAPEVLSEILRGGAEKVREAGAAIAGGHTTTDAEPKYGLAAVGLVHPQRLLTKGGVRAGDALLLTKPLGTGVITTAHKQRKVDEADLATAIETMVTLNRDAARVLAGTHGEVRACTDVTGFGLIGHAHEMAHASGLALRLVWDAVPLLPGAGRYAREGRITGGSARNREFYGSFRRERRALEGWQDELLHDPQTSGGLLAAVAGDRVDGVLGQFERAGVSVWRVGDAVEGEAGVIEIV